MGKMRGADTFCGGIGKVRGDGEVLNEIPFDSRIFKESKMSISSTNME